MSTVSLICLQTDNESEYDLNHQLSAAISPNLFTSCPLHVDNYQCWDEYNLLRDMATGKSADNTTLCREHRAGCCCNEGGLFAEEI